MEALTLLQIADLNTDTLEALSRKVLAQLMEEMDFESPQEGHWFCKHVCGMTEKQISAALKTVADDGEGA